MGEFFLGAGSALWLGILTSISPCPLATNIAAISFVGRRLGSSGRVLLAGGLYTAGRSVTYLCLGAVLVAGALSAPQVSYVLQKYMNKLLGPVLILVGMFMWEMLRFGLSARGISDNMQRRAERWGVWGAALLGVLFAMSFCPLSAAIFFGSLIPISVKCGSSVALPSLYGIGTGLPVIAFAVLIALGARRVGSAFKKLSRIEWWAQRVTGTIFIGVGIYYSLAHIFGLF